MTVARFIGALLIVAGVLIAALCGLCTLAFVGESIGRPSGGQEFSGDGMVPFALLLGGVPTVFGCLMIWAGVLLVRAGRKPAAPPVEPETFD